MSSPAILNQLANTANRAVTVTIPEGSNIYQVDNILANALIIQRADSCGSKKIMEIWKNSCVPDTYQFFPGSDVKNVVQTMLAIFKLRLCLFCRATRHMHSRTVIIASLLDKEVPGEQDQEVPVARIIQQLLLRA